MHGFKGSRKRIRHMRPVCTSTGGLAAAAVDDSGAPLLSSAASFTKDVRKINVGDCALFKPQQDSPPFIGIIRSLGTDKENLQLSVNWLYRPADVKLLKGLAPEAAPNEVFYSFHRDETPAASLLHPCKVAFLPRGVELPSGISSFVCRRVYDTANKRLWWLTDQDYIDDRQEEVDQLLRKTQLEMHATVQQQGGRSPKPVNSPMSTSQVKHSPDSVQNSTTVFPSQSKGKKRERSDQASEPVKRERSSKADDVDYSLQRTEGVLKFEIAKITEKGGLVGHEGVERLVHLMQPDKSEKKMDLTCRSLLAGVIAATDSVDCLNQFVQLRGLCVLDEWLQEAHKGKIGDSSSPRDQDRSVEDFLLILLRALDRLPVNLNALQMCNIGKSVNHLRSHRNSEIQKKARSLVDTWKKRVEAEMNINDSKSGTSQAVSWPARTRNEVSQVGNRNPSGSSDATMKNSISQLSSSKSAPVKLVQGETAAKSPSTSASPGNVKLASPPATTSASLRDGHLRTSVISCSSELPQSAARDEKSSGSSQSHTNSQCSSDHAKNMGPSAKEDARSSNSGSTSLNKCSGGSSRHRKAANGLQGLAVSTRQKDGGSSRNSSLTRVSVAEKQTQLPVTNEKAMEVPVSDSNNHKLIVKISNRGRSPAQSVNGEGLSSTNSRASSPVLSEKHGQLDHSLKEKTDGFRNNTPSDVNTESWQSNDLKDGATGCDEDGSPATVPDFGRPVGDEAGKLTDAMKVISTKTEVKSRKSIDSSLSSINALIDSCVKCSDANAPISVGDDVGMNLLASVAAGEISNSKSGVVSPAHSPQRSTSMPAKEESQIELPVASQGLCVSSEAEDKVKVSPLHDEFEKKAPRDIVLCPPKDEEKTNASQKSLAVASKIDSMSTDEKVGIVSAGSGQHLAAVITSEVKSEGVAITDGSQEGNRISDKVNDPSSLPEKQGEPGVCCADADHDRSCKDQNSENIDPPAQPSGSSAAQVTAQQSGSSAAQVCAQQSGSSAAQISCSAVALPEAKLLSDAEGTKLTVVKEENKETSGSATENVAQSPAAGGPDVDTKLGFDLNEGFNVDDGKNGEPFNLGSGSCSDIGSSVSPLHIAVSSASCGLPASVTVAAAAKGPFVPPDDLLRNKQEVGWRGSAATSAFRPAEPRKAIPHDSPACRPARVPLDIDLNVADESSGQEFNTRNNPMCELMTTASLRSSGGLDLDLNKVDEASDMTLMGRHMVSSIQKAEVSTQYIKPSTSNIYTNGASSGKRDFDLNDGPATEELPVEQLPSRPLNSGNLPLQSSFGPRINSSDTGNCYSWYPPGTSYSVSMTPPILPDRDAFSIVGIGGGPQRVVGGPNTALSFNPDAYSGSVLSSSPALPFHPAPFQYPVLPFGTSFPLPTSALAGGSSGYMDPTVGGRISAIPSQLVGNAAAVSFPYPHAYVVSRPIPDVGNNGVIGSNHKWGKQGLDLNSGPGVLDMEGRDESLPIVSRQVSAISSQSLAEEQARMYSMGGGHIKRKEPEGGWNIDKLNFKQSSWR